MTRFPTPTHSSLARLAPGVRGSAGRKKGTCSTGHGDRFLAKVPGEAAVGVAKTHTFLDERYRRIARRRGKKKAIVAVGRSILVITWHLLSDPEVGCHDLGPTTTKPGSTHNIRSATTSANSKPSATRSPSSPLPDPPNNFHSPLQPDPGSAQPVVMLSPTRASTRAPLTSRSGAGSAGIPSKYGGLRT